MRRGKSGREASKVQCLQPCGLSAQMLSHQGYASTKFIPYHDALATPFCHPMTATSALHEP